MVETVRNTTKKYQKNEQQPTTTTTTYSIAAEARPSRNTATMAPIVQVLLIHVVVDSLGQLRD